MASASPHCPNCRAPLAAGTGLCGTCGMPAGRHGAAPAQPPSAPMPATFSGGASRTISLAQPVGEVPRLLALALQSAGASVTGIGAQVVTFTAAKRSARSLGIGVRYRGVAEIAPAGGHTTVTLRAKPDLGSVTVVSILATVLLLVLVLLGNGGQLFPEAPAGSPEDYTAGKSFGALVFLAGLGGGIPYLLLSRGGARQALATLIQPITAAATAGPVPHGAAAGPASDRAATDGIFAQLRELNALRDQGILSAAEHDQARAALLAKIA